MGAEANNSHRLHRNSTDRFAYTVKLRQVTSMRDSAMENLDSIYCPQRARTRRARIRTLASIIPFLVVATAGSAQGGPPQQDVTGTVFDSVAARPLADAIIQLRPADTTASRNVYSARSDARGRFRIDSVTPGVYVAGFFHESLDSLGLAPPLREVHVGARSTSVALAVPSARTIITTLCGAAAVSDSTGTLIGFVRDARTLAGAADATVFIRWTRVILKPIVRIEQPEATAPARDNGWFALCNVPVGLPIQVVAASGGDSSGAVSVVAQAKGLDRVDLYVGESEPAGDSAQLAIDSLLPESVVRRGPARLTVRVRRSDGRRVSGAVVHVAGSRETALSNDSGTAHLVDLPSGSRMLQVRAVGFVPVHEHVRLLQRPEPNEVDVTLTDARSYLDTVRVVARRVFSRDASGFERRKRMGLGTFIDRDVIDRKRPFYTTELFRGIPAVTLSQGRFGSTLVLMRGSFGGTCSPAVYVDGLRFGSGDIDFVSFPEDLEAVEVYVRGSQSPPMFSDPRGTCGSIVLWSRRYMGTLRR